MCAQPPKATASRMSALLLTTVGLSGVKFPQPLLPALCVGDEVRPGALLAALLVISRVHALHAQEPVAITRVVPVRGAALAVGHRRAAGNEEGRHQEGGNDKRASPFHYASCESRAPTRPPASPLRKPRHPVSRPVCRIARRKQCPYAACPPARHGSQCRTSSRCDTRRHPWSRKRPVSGR